jgi:hypothetical protein
LAFVCAASGCFLIRRGIQQRRKASAMADWPVVNGKVLASKVTETVDAQSDGPDITRYIPVVTYAYEVDGKALQSDVIRIGLNQFGRNLSEARRYVGRYPIGATVSVRYDPSNPSIAILEVGHAGSGAIIFTGCFLILAGFAFASMAYYS